MIHVSFDFREKYYYRSYLDYLNLTFCSDHGKICKEVKEKEKLDKY